jgi:truncated hemoglobin YjbI
MTDRTDEVLKAIEEAKEHNAQLHEGFRQQQSAQHDEQLSFLKMLWGGVTDLTEKFARFLRPGK